CVNWDRDYW
nr:immunoglobulin heavy chain junction region [Mus musculus]